MTAPEERVPVDVAAGVLIDARGRFLLTSRPEGKVYAGYWEFPGGKLEPGETVVQVLRPELHAELGIAIGPVQPWKTERMDYPHARVRLHFCKVFARRVRDARAADDAVGATAGGGSPGVAGDLAGTAMAVAGTQRRARVVTANPLNQGCSVGAVLATISSALSNRCNIASVRDGLLKTSGETMKKFAFAAGLASLVVGGAASAAPTYYGTRAAFDTANVGLTFEGFESMDAVGTVGFTSPLSSTSNIAGVVSPGEIVAGITFDMTTGHDAYVAAPGQSANTSRAIGVNTPTAAGWKVSFDAPTNAFGVDVYQNFGGGNQSGSSISVTVNLYNLSSALIDSSLITVPSGSNGFFGVYSASGISYLTIDNADSFDVIDNVEFGTAPAIPEPSTYALMALGLAGIAGVARRRQAR